MIRLCLVVVVCVVGCFLQSCNLMAGASYILSEEPQQEAIFVLPDVPTVVFVDDRRNLLHPSRLRRVVADQITELLLKENVVATLISPQDIMRVSATKDRYGNILTIGELGEAVGASTVVYVEMTAFALTTDGQTPNPVANCRVRVIDVDHKKRLFPVNDASYPIVATLGKVDPYNIHAISEMRKLAEELSEELGKKVAEMFYLHYTGRLGENLKRK